MEECTLSGRLEIDSFTIHVAGTVRNCGEGLETRLVDLEEALRAATGGELQFHLFENDSRDSTRAEIIRFGSIRPNVTIHVADGLEAEIPVREERLAHCRNRLLESISAAESPPRAASIYLPVDLDLDIDWSSLATPLRDAITLVRSGSLDGVFPVSTPLYYDIHALRAAGWNSRDPWAAVSWAESHRVYQRSPQWMVRGALVYAKQVPTERLTRRGRLFPVGSAFGGFGIYLVDRIKDRKYQSTVEDRCEHVFFNRGLKVALMTDLAIAAPTEHLGSKVFGSRAQRALIRAARSLHPLR